MVDDLEAVKAFFLALGLAPEGEATVEGPEVGQLIGLEHVRATLSTLRPPGGGAGIELDKFHTPPAVRHGPDAAPVNALAYRRVMFAVEDLEAIVTKMRGNGAEVIGEMRYGGSFVGLAAELTRPPRRSSKKPVRSSKSPGRSRRKPGRRSSTPSLVRRCQSRWSVP